jgi:hypothetical protein
MTTKTLKQIRPDDTVTKTFHATEGVPPVCCYTMPSGGVCGRLGKTPIFGTQSRRRPMGAWVCLIHALARSRRIHFNMGEEADLAELKRDYAKMRKAALAVAA